VAGASYIRMVVDTPAGGRALVSGIPCRASWDHAIRRGGEATLRAFMASLVIAIAALVGLASPAAAEYCGASANGCEHSQGNTICAGHGAFGAFGDKSGDPATHDFRGGASGDRTA